MLKYLENHESKLLREFAENIKKQEEEHGIEIQIPEGTIRDEEHLDCLWYGGEIGSILYKGYQIVIGAYGDVRLEGKINGRSVYVKDKCNLGDAYNELGSLVNDEKLHQLLESEDKDNHLYIEDGNWFEFNLIDSNGMFIDLCGADNVLDDNLLDCFDSVQDYFEYVDAEIAEKETLWN